MTPQSVININSSTGRSWFSLRSSSEGIYSIKYLIYSQERLATPTLQQYLVVYGDTSNISREFFNDEWVLKSPGCCTSNLTGLCHSQDLSLSSSCSLVTGSGSIKTRGISFIHSRGLSLPLSIIGASVSPSSLTLSPLVSEDSLTCNNCSHDSSSCINGTVKPADSAMLANNDTLLKTFLRQVRTLVPSEVTLTPSEGSNQRNRFISDFMSDLISENDDECPGLHVTSPSYLLKSNSSLRVNVNGESFSYHGDQFVCFSLPLCSVPFPEFSPLTVSVPVEGSNALTSSLSGFRYYLNRAWSLLVKAVDLSMYGAISNINIVNGLRLWNGNEWVSMSLPVHQVQLSLAAGHSTSEENDLNVRTNFTGQVSLSLQENNVCLY